MNVQYLVYSFMLFFLSLSSISAQQDSVYTAQSDSAWTIYKQKDYAKALKIYERLSEEYEFEKAGNHYNAACCASLVGSIDRAFYHLEKSIDFGFWERASLFKTDTDLDTLRKDNRFKPMIQRIEALVKQKVLNIRIKNSKLTHDSEGRPLRERALQQLEGFSSLSGKELYQKLSNFTISNPYHTDSIQTVCLWLPYADTLEIPYLIQLPSGFNNVSPSGLFIQLHGGVRHVNGYPSYLGPGSAQSWNRYFSKYANEQGLIAVYPYGTKWINWMYPDQGFDLIPKIIKQLKILLNIDEDRVFLCGHSNGATGSFSYAMKNQDPFAGFFGLNTHPQVYTGGTYILNLKNRNFHAISTDQDYYYPQGGIDSLLKLSQTSGFNFTNDLYKGFPHWFPEFDESEPAIKKMFEKTSETRRPTLPTELYWECDDVKHGQHSWLSIETLDTLAKAAPWHQQINFKVSNWVDVDDERKIIPDKTEEAFLFPRKSAAVKANYQSNTFEIETSRVKKIRLYFHPEMIDLEKPVRIIINGQQKWQGKLHYNVQCMLAQFRKTFDRKRVWIQEVVLEVE